ncbi:MAG: carboxypeptidase-like regulatory domain-containing protein [Crocinitomicaceae bacterium]|nr:carboxypeptidase-like regulatory domain-containing protein [Crocinitomicaceae bacterium]
MRITEKYNNVPLSLILKDLHKKYDVNISYDSNNLPQDSCSAVFESATLETVLAHILTPSKLTWRFIGNTVVIFPQDIPTQKSDSIKAMKFSWRGCVRDAETGEPLPYALIRIGGTLRNTTTDNLGQFELSSITSDTCVAFINYIGYEEKKVAVRYTGAGIKRQCIDLVPLNTLLPVAEVVERGGSTLQTDESPGLSTIIPSDISTTASNGEQDLMKTAQFLPGVSATNENSGGLIIRGSDIDQTLILFDDFTIYHLDHFYGVFSAINTKAVRNMRIHKSGMEARYGGRIAGIAEITGKEGNHYHRSAQVDIGPLSSNIFIESPVGYSEKASVMIAARRSYTDIFPSFTYKKQFNTVYAASILTDPDEDNDEFSKSEIPEFYYGDLTGKITVRPSAKDVVQLSGYAGIDNLSLSYTSFLNNRRIESSYNDYNKWGNRGAGTRWTHEYSPLWKSLLTVGWSQYESNLFAQDTVTDHLLQVSETLFRNNSQKLSDFTSRAELSFSGESSPFVFGMQSTVISIHKREQSPNNIAFEKKFGSIYSGYAQKTISIRKLVLTPGVRMNYFTVTKKSYPELRLNGILKLSNTIAIKSSAGRVHQFIHRVKQQSLYLNNPDQWELSAENTIPVLQSDQLSLGMRWNKNQWTLDAEAYLKFNRGSFEYLGPYTGKSDIAIAPDNILKGRGKAQGIDLFLQKEWALQTCWLSYSLMKAYNDFDSGEELRIAELFDQRHEIKTGYQKKFKHWNVGVTWYYGTGRPYTPYLGSYDIHLISGYTVSVPVFGNLNSGRLPSYHRLDISGGYRFRWLGADIRINFSIFNTYNHTNVRDIQYLAFTDSDNDIAIVQRNILMQGFLPSFNLSIKL